MASDIQLFLTGPQNGEPTELAQLAGNRFEVFRNFLLDRNVLFAALI